MVIATKSVPTPIGTLGLVGSDAGLAAVHWTAETRASRESCAVLDTAAEQLRAYFAGELLRFDVELDLRGTDFQRGCWLALASIPPGQTFSYVEQALRLGLSPSHARAVGAANGRNPVPIILPCHRLVGSDGSLTGFGGGLEVKRFLLEHEGARFCGPAASGYSAESSSSACSLSGG